MCEEGVCCVCAGFDGSFHCPARLTFLHICSTAPPASKSSLTSFLPPPLTTSRAPQSELPPTQRGRRRAQVVCLTPFTFLVLPPFVLPLLLRPRPPPRLSLRLSPGASSSLFLKQDYFQGLIGGMNSSHSLPFALYVPLLPPFLPLFLPHILLSPPRHDRRALHAQIALASSACGAYTLHFPSFHANLCVPPPIYFHCEAPGCGRGARSCRFPTSILVLSPFLACFVRASTLIVVWKQRKEGERERKRQGPDFLGLLHHALGGGVEGNIRRAADPGKSRK